MYKCDWCFKTIGPGIPLQLTTTETRTKTYPLRPKANFVKKNGTVEVYDDEGGVGWEIVRTAKVCPSCANPAGT